MQSKGQHKGDYQAYLVPSLTVLLALLISLLVWTSRPLLCNCQSYSLLKSSKEDRCGPTPTNKAPENIRRIVGPFYSDWIMLAKMVMNPSEHLAFGRYADGEFGIMSGIPVNGIDNWKYDPKSMSVLAADLNATLRGFRGQPYYYGFSSFEGIPVLTFMLRHLDQDLNHVTYSNLW